MEPFGRERHCEKFGEFNILLDHQSHVHAARRHTKNSVVIALNKAIHGAVMGTVASTSRYSTECHYPLIAQIKIRPAIALARPTARKVASGDSSTDASARFVTPGKAAKTNPSITNTSPSADRKSNTRGYRGVAGVGVVAGCVAGCVALGLPEGSAKNRKKSESGLTTSRVSEGRNPASYACIER